MATTVEDIRFKVESYIQNTIQNDNVINWCNDAQTDFLLPLDIPDIAVIPITPNELTYTLPDGFKRIGRMWLQGVYDSGVDAPLEKLYRIYNGKIIFYSRFGSSDTLNLEYYRHLKYFVNIEDTIDLEDRFSPLYVSYCLSQYYSLPNVIDAKGEGLARREYEKNYERYLAMKDQVAGYHVMNVTPSEIQGVW